MSNRITRWYKQRKCKHHNKEYSQFPYGINGYLITPWICIDCEKYGRISTRDEEIGY